MSEYTVTVHERVADLKRNEWNAVVADQSHTGSVFERHEWLTAYERAFDATGAHVQVRKSGTLVGAHPLFERSLPRLPVSFLGPPRPEYNGVHATTDERAVVTAALRAVDSRCRGRTIGHLCKPASSRSLGYAALLRERGYTPTVRGCQFHLDTDRSWEAVRDDFDHTRRRNLDRADEAGVTVEERDVTRETVRSFAAAHRRNMARIGGDGTTRRFLRALAVEMPERIVVFAADADGEDLGQLFCVVDREQDQLHLLFPGFRSDRDQRYPSDALYAAAIRWAIAHDIGAVNFGETDSDLSAGPYRFKTKFGATPVPTLRWERVRSRLGRALYAAGSELVYDSLFPSRDDSGPA